MVGHVLYLWKLVIVRENDRVAISGKFSNSCGPAQIDMVLLNA